jgi:hypothetical protein
MQRKEKNKSKRKVTRRIAFGKNEENEDKERFRKILMFWGLEVKVQERGVVKDAKR